MSDRPLFSPPRPGALHRWLFVSSLLAGGLLSLGVGFVAHFSFLVWIAEGTKLAPGPQLVVAIALVFAAGLTAVMVKLHSCIFQEEPETDAGWDSAGRPLVFPQRGRGLRRLLAALTFVALLAALVGVLVWVFRPAPG